LRKICLSFPETHEVEAWGEPTFRVRNKIFAMFASPGNHHGGGRPAVWLKAMPEDQTRVLRADPECFFKPPYVGVAGWIGIWLDRPFDLNDLAEFVEQAYRLIAPKRIVAAWDEQRQAKGHA
jgi:predicted DNA-binding protein (MmcQ/YjbR family)